MILSDLILPRVHAFRSHIVMPPAAPDEQLAIHGGPRALDGAPPPWPRPDEQVREALQRAWSDGSWGRYHAEHCDRLAETLASMHECEFVTLCSSGTIAVELALRGLKIGPDDEVVIAGYDFPGNFRAIEAIGAQPVVVDLEPGSWRIDTTLLAQAISPKTRAVVVSHLHGDLVDMSKLMDLARNHNLLVVEDACQVPGAAIGGRCAGAWGDVGVLSFGGSKLLTAGRGGAVISSDAEIHQRMRVFANRGNEAFPLSQLQAAVLLPQVKKLSEQNASRRRAVDRLLAQIASVPGLRPLAAIQPGAVFYKVPWYYVANELGDCPLGDFIAALEAEGVQVGPGFRGFVGRTSRRCRKVGELPHSQRAAESTLLLHHPILLESDARLDALAGALKKVSRAFSG